jgi:hypothetical protein
MVGEEMKGEGFYFPKIPEVTMQDINKHSGAGSSN